MTGVVVGLDVEHLDERQADHDLRELAGALPAGTVLFTATHWATQGERPHVALSAELVGLPPTEAVALLVGRLGELAATWSLSSEDELHGAVALHGAARAAREAHQQRRSGRVVHFPGVEALVGTMTAQELLDRSAVERVRVLASGDAPADISVVTRAHVRPTWVDGALVLLTQPAAGGTLVPFESPDPTPCCVDH